MLLASLVGATLVGLVSRTPASVRLREPGPGATEPSLGAEFSDADVARHGAYRGPLYLAFVIGAAVQLLTLLVVARAGGGRPGLMGRLVDRLDGVPGGWPVHAALAAVALTLLLTLVGLPLSFVRGYAIQHAWDLSTQDVGGWLSDVVRGALVSAVTLAISAVAFFGLVRWRPGSWWLWGWGAFTILTAVLVFLYPVVIAPLFYRFTPLEDAALAARIKSMASDAGVAVDEVLVADASRRTTSENAYVAGLGSTRRMVVYDTLLDSGDEDETLFIVAHELGHQSHNHVVRNIVVASVGLFAGFAVLALLAGRGALWSWAGAGGVSDVRALPLLAAFVLIAGLVMLPAQNAVSRRFEAQADRAAIELTGDSDTATRTFRRLAFSNIADLRPPGIAVAILYTHPPIADRITASERAAR